MPSPHTTPPMKVRISVIGLLSEGHPAGDPTDNRDNPYGVNYLGLIGCLKVTLGELVDVHEPSGDTEEAEDVDNER